MVPVLWFVELFILNCISGKSWSQLSLFQELAFSDWVLRRCSALPGHFLEAFRWQLYVRGSTRTSWIGSLVRGRTQGEMGMPKVAIIPSKALIACCALVDGTTNRIANFVNASTMVKMCLLPFIVSTDGLS